MVSNREIERKIVQYLRSYKPSLKLTLTEAAAKLGVTRHRIRQTASKYNLPLKFEGVVDLTERLKELDRAENNGTKTKEIKPETKKSETVPKKQYRTSKISEEGRRFLRENFDKPVSYLSKKIGFSETTVRRYLLKEGLVKKKVN